MSFFDDASLAFLPSGAAGKDGKAYSIKPVPVYGSELVTNGDFATDSDWTKGAGSTISGGSLNIVAAPYNANTRQSLSLTNGTTYEIVINAIAVGSATDNTFQLGFADSAGNPSNTTQHEFAVGTSVKKLIVTASATDVAIIFRSRDAGTSNLSITNVSVKEVLVADGDFTFSRGSNLAATRIGADGLIEKGRENLILQSNNFDNAGWNKQNVVVSTNSVQNPFNTGTTFTMTEQVSTTQYRIYTTSHSTTSGTMYTHSVYVKRLSGTRDFAIIDVSGGARVYFNMTTISVGSEAVGKGKIEDVGNGWYRLSVYGVATGSGALYLAMANGTTTGSETYTSDGSGSFALYAAQLEIGLAATDVIETGATTGKAGLLEDEPRFDYSGGATCPSLLLEPSRTQLFEQSEYFGGWAANPGGISSIEPNYAISPEGVENAYKVNFVVQGDSDLALVKGHSVTGGSTYAYSIYIKGEGSDIGKDIVVKSKRSGGDSAGTTTTQTLTGEWVRVDFTTTYAANNAAANFYISSNDATSCLIYGAQAELGSYPTSYIPNHSGTGSVTRGAEKQEITGLTSTQLNQTEGSIYLELQTYSTDAGRFTITSYPDGASGDTMRFIFGNNIQFSKVDTGGLNTSINPTASKVKVIGTYSGTELKLCVNGGAVQSSSGNFSFTNQPTKVYTHAFIDTIRLFAEVDQFLYFPEALSNADCIALTS